MSKRYVVKVVRKYPNDFTTTSYFSGKSFGFLSFTNLENARRYDEAEATEIARAVGGEVVEISE